MPSGISKWVCRHTSQDVCSHNVKFAQELKEPAFEDHDPLVRSHSAWALGRIGSASAADAFRRRLAAEGDASVIGALEAAVAARRN